MFHTQHISHTPAQYIISDIFRVDICGSALVLISHTRVVLMEIARGLPETRLHIFYQFAISRLSELSDRGFVKRTAEGQYMTAGE